MNYWIMCLNNLHEVCGVIFLLVSIVLVFVAFVYLIATEEDKKLIIKFFKNWRKTIFTILIICFIGLIFVPSRSDMKYYDTVDKFIKYIEKTDIMFVTR